MRKRYLDGYFIPYKYLDANEEFENEEGDEDEVHGKFYKN